MIYIIIYFLFTSSLLIIGLFIFFYRLIIVDIIYIIYYKSMYTKKNYYSRFHNKSLELFLPRTCKCNHLQLGSIERIQSDYLK